MRDSSWRLISFLQRSKYRLKVVETLYRSKAPLTPTDISELTDIHVSNISRTIKQLREADLIECLNPGDSKGRLYKITDTGDEVLTQVLEIDKSKKSDLSKV